MKRSISAAVLLVAVAFFPIIADAAPMVIHRGATVNAAIEVIVVCAGLNGQTLDPGAYINGIRLSADVAIEETCTADQWTAAMKEILPPQFTFFKDEEGILHIRPVKLTAATPEPTRRSRPAAAIAQRGTEAYRLRKMDPNYDPCAYGDYGCRAQEAPRERVERPNPAPASTPDPRISAEQTDAEAYRLRRMNPGYSPCAYEDYGCRGYGGYDGYYEAQRRRIEGASKMGWLKIYGVGDTKFAKHLLVVRRAGQTWVAVGAGGKAFRTFHDPMELPIGHHTLRFEIHLDDGTMKCHERDFEIESKFDRDHALQYPVSAGMFKSYPGCE